MKKIFITFVSLLSLNLSLGQATGAAPNNSVGGISGGSAAALNYMLGPINQQNKKLSEKEQGIIGSAYTSEKFLPGQLYYGNDFEGNVFYRYNAYNEEIEVSDVNVPGASVRTLNRDKKIKLISVNGYPIQFKTYIDGKKLTQNGYLTQLRSGKYNLYKRVDVKYTQSQSAQNSFIPAKPARFTQFTQYYLEVEGRNKLQELELSKRKVLKLLPAEVVDAVKAYSKENKVNFKDQYGLFKIIDYLNGM
jgi:hypothetical protein